MKKLMLSLFLVSSLALTTTAQEVKDAAPATASKKQQNPEEHSKKSADWATKNLGLDGDQKVKWQKAAFERITSNSPLREKLKGPTTPEERKPVHQQMKANMDKFNTDVNTFLTADQKIKWEKLLADKKAKHKAKKDGEVDLDPEK